MWAIRRLFEKSLPLMLFFAVLSFVVTAAFALVFQTGAREKAWAGYSRDTLAVTIGQENVGGKLFTNADFLSFFKRCPAPVTLVQANAVTRQALFYATAESSLRDFGANASLFSRFETRPAAILAETERQRCVERGGKMYDTSRNLEFEVLAFYPRHTHPYAGYFPLVYILEQRPGEVFQGSFYLDAGENTQQIYQSLHDAVLSVSSVAEISANPLDGTQARRTQSTQADTAYSSVIVTVVVCVMLLNLYHIVYYWLAGKRKELDIRMLTGAPAGRLVRQMAVRFFAAAAIAALLGGGAAWLCIGFGLFFPRADAESAIAALGCSALLVLAGVGVGTTMLVVRLRRQIQREWGG